MAEVTSMLMELGNSKSTDIDEIPIMPLKYVIQLTSHRLSRIYNLSLLQGHYSNKYVRSKGICDS